MASNALRAGAGKLPRAAAQPLTAWGIGYQTLRGLASLKLTVLLFALSIFLIFAGTLAQVDQDMWQVINNYFHAPFVWIPLQVFFPKTWVPGWQSVAGYLPFPGGSALGCMLFVNLLAAHTIRFKLQATRGRLSAGIIVILLGVALTAAVISSGFNSEGLQGEPPLGWSTMWLAVKWATAALAVAATIGTGYVWHRGAPRASVVVAAGVIAALLCAFSIWLFVSGVYLGDSGMRILWQLIKGQAAGLVLLLGCWLAFKKRGGIVLIHGGVGLLMLGELLVGAFAYEERMMIDEGDTVNYAVDIRSTELAVTDSSQPETDRVTVVPLWVKGRESSIVRQKQRVSNDNLPFDVEVVQYLRNSEIIAAKSGGDNRATVGKGLESQAVAARPGSGADSSGEVDMASAYIRFLHKGSKDEIGTFLLSQIVLSDRRGGLFSFDETIPIDGKDYAVELRFKRTYKPYSLRLLDVRKDDYIGTSTPRDYSSDVHLVDAARHVDREVHIWMNNPLRYAGETFYQSGYHRDEAGRETTTLQVVRNTGWMMPYVACMLVMTGLVAHFPMILLRYLGRLASDSPAGRGKTERPIEAELATAPRQSKKSVGAKPRREAGTARPAQLRDTTKFREPSTLVTFIVASVVVLLFAGWLAGKTRPPQVGADGMDWAEFGRLPLVYEGRVKPFDTLARNSLRVLSTKEELATSNGKLPAIRWLLDVISDAPQAAEHRVFRIDHFDVLHTLRLARRKSHLYSFAEIEPRMDEFRKQVRQAHETPEDQLTIFQHKVMELDNRMQLYFKLREAFRLPAESLAADDQAEHLIGLAGVGQELAASPVPYAIPKHDSEGRSTWEPLVTAVARLWCRDIAAKHQVTTVSALAEQLASDMLSDRNIELLMQNRLLSMIKSMAPQDVKPEQLDAYARDAMQRMPADMRERIGSSVRDEIVAGKGDLQANLANSLSSLLGAGGLAGAENPAARSMWNMLVAYRDGQAAGFNKELDQYRKALATDAPADLDFDKSRFEAAFNHFAPFYNCAALYVFAFILTGLGWMAWVFHWNRPFNWSAFGLIAFTFVVHTVALMARIYISGRPPVTNLYSSAVFIGWAGVALGLVLELAIRMGIGNVVSAVSGFCTLVIAHQLAGDGDTFTVLQAVLDTQFWLATHVVSVTLGYATTFVAGLLGIIFIIAGLITPVLSEPVGTQNIRRALANMIYGIICFALLFSFLGTVLGGLWADDSWGRFWGWDPKENGALIIVLWNALVLHARWDGLVRDRGLAVLAVVGNIVTSWSWFGVNELGVGLHSYGFTEGVLFYLSMFVLSQLCFIAIGSLPKHLWWSFRAEQRLGSIWEAEAVT